MGWLWKEKVNGVIIKTILKPCDFINDWRHNKRNGSINLSAF